jgi:hypothetical protein
MDAEPGIELESGLYYSMSTHYHHMSYAAPLTDLSVVNTFIVHRPPDSKYRVHGNGCFLEYTPASGGRMPIAHPLSL